jgi:hypothetical protein
MRLSEIEDLSTESFNSVKVLYFFDLIIYKYKKFSASYKVEFNNPQLNYNDTIYYSQHPLFVIIRFYCIGKFTANAMQIRTFPLEKQIVFN